MDHVKIMINEPRRPVAIEIDMTPDGRFADTPGVNPAPVASRLFRAAVVIGVLSLVAALVALTLWVALALIPIAIGVGVVAYLAMRFQVWRRGNLGRGGNPWR
jgi:hypothetical protein